MNAQRYTVPAVVLHWLQAALIAWLFWLGWTMVDLPKGGPERSAAYNLHKSLGLVVLMLAFARVAWRRGNAPPPTGMSGWEETVAKVTHGLLYAFIVGAPLAGYLASSFTAYPVKFFGVELPRLWAEDKAMNGLFKELHAGLIWVGAALIALHVLGALRHGVGRGSSLARMLPWGKT